QCPEDLTQWAKRIPHDYRTRLYDEIWIIWQVKRHLASHPSARGKKRHECPKSISRTIRPLAARPRRVLGRSLGGNRLDRTGKTRIRSRCWRLRALVRRRRLQHLLERGRPPREPRPWRAAGDYL